MAVLMTVQVFGDVTLLIGSLGLLNSEEECTMILPNIGNCLPVNMV